MVANEGLEKARAYLNQAPSKGHESNPSPQFYYIFGSGLNVPWRDNNPCYQWGQILGPYGLQSSTLTTFAIN